MASIILASSSPRRRDLLQREGYDFIVQAADVEEQTPPDLTPAEITLFNARLKAQAVAKEHPASLVIGVDTLVAFEGEVFGKPRDMDHAFAMISRLNGRVHEVWSSVWLAQGARETGFSEVTRVKFRQLTNGGLISYLERIQPLDKAGSYAAQDDQGEIIECVEGCFDNVVGLPMKSLAWAIEKFSAPQG